MRCAVYLFISWSALGAAVAAEDVSGKRISYSRDVRPILAENCFRCHGPDDKKRQADLRLDREEDAKRPRNDGPALTAGRISESALWHRIISTNDDRMPPPDAGQKLTADQIQILKRWIEQGADWEQHWSLIPPVRTDLPQIVNREWIRSPIDCFILARLESEKLTPSAVADKETLIRRVTLDLTGLPPTLDEIDAFLLDESPNAYEKVVDRLLASPRYGERMAWSWLEAARYADTSGYQNDGPRSMWRWRDWVIEAFNAGVSFAQFTRDQLAGDLLPNASLDQRIATGFNRNHRGNSEGGIIPEEYQVEYVVDRVDTTATVWLGLTLGCARCHDHKYDPITQRDFYRVFAYFNNIPEQGRAVKEGNSPPYVTAPTPEQQRQLTALDAGLQAARQRWEKLQEPLEAAQIAWEESKPSPELSPKQTTDTTYSHFPLESLTAPDQAGWKVVNGDPKIIDGVIGQGISFDGTQHLEVGDLGNFGYFDRFTIALWLRPSSLKSGTIVSRMTDEEQADGWYVQLRDGHVQVNLVKRWLDDALRVESVQPIAANHWSHLVVTYDGSRLARGVTVYLDGRPLLMTAKLDQLNQTMTVKEPLRIAGGNGPAGKFAGSVDELQVFKRCLPADEVLQLATAQSIAEILQTARKVRTDGQRLKLRSYFLQAAAAEEVRNAFAEYAALRSERQHFVENLPTVMVMHELPSPRESRVLIRGEYNRPGEVVSPAVPVCFGPTSADGPKNRLGFAQWLTAPTNPLTARVAMNRLWQTFFAAGLVRSTEDFGIQGEPPSHPELLDWLAVEFSESKPAGGASNASSGEGWDLKQMQRQIVTSATYRQTSSWDASRTLAESRLMARSPRFRLSAEMVRDQALAASGLLVERLGGPSVKTYQPADLWKDLATDSVYDQDHGANLYRRSLYTYWKRTVAPPSMTGFDAAGRDSCEVRTPRTNTPLQALTLLNEVTFVEAARVMAQNALLEHDSSAEMRLKNLFRRVTGRRPTDSEVQVLLKSLQRNLDYFRRAPEQAQALLKVGEYPVPTQLPPAELAAYATVCNLLLNLDEVVTRQ